MNEETESLTGKRWQRFRSRLPMTLALLGVAAVWILGCVWSFTEQAAFAAVKGFGDPTLLPLVLDGLAASMAGVAYAASLDGRFAVPARLGTAFAVLASAASNGTWAAQRTGSIGHPDVAAVVIGVGIPIAANIAFEVLLGELRRQVQRSRGLPAPVAVPGLRPVRFFLAPVDTFRSWRRQVLALTELAPVPDTPPEPVTAGTLEDELEALGLYPAPVLVPAPSAPLSPMRTGVPGRPTDDDLRERLAEWRNDPDEPRPTVDRVRTRYSVGTDRAARLLREVPPCRV